MNAKELLEWEDKPNFRYKPYVSKDNLEELNNLGHKEVTEDFSDSPIFNTPPLEE